MPYKVFFMFSRKKNIDKQRNNALLIYLLIYLLENNIEYTLLVVKALK